MSPAESLTDRALKFVELMSLKELIEFEANVVMYRQLRERQRTLTADQLVALAKRPVRICRTLHHCAICQTEIIIGQKYYDGGYGRRAHKNCLSWATEAK